MATYKGIKGFKVQSLASDPTAEDTVGKVWYNTAGYALKYSGEGAGAWASGGAVNTARTSTAGLGTQTAALLAGGSIPTPAITVSALTEEYNGTSWTEVGDLNLARALYSAGAGTTTAGLGYGGYFQPNQRSALTETYNGTAWTEVNDLTTARYTSGCGVQTAALAVGGGTTPAIVAIVEAYDGTSWTETGDVSSAIYNNAVVGTTTAALKFGGAPGQLDIVEQFNGTSWTEVNDLNTGRSGPGGSGTSTLALCFGGYRPAAPATNYALTEKWDGTSWTEVADLAQARAQGGQVGTQSSALWVSGANAITGAYYTVTEEWSDPVYSAKTVTTS